MFVSFAVLVPYQTPVLLESIVYSNSPADMCINCVFYDTSMTFDPHLEHAKKCFGKGLSQMFPWKAVAAIFKMATEKLFSSYYNNNYFS